MHPELHEIAREQEVHGPVEGDPDLAGQARLAQHQHEGHRPRDREQDRSLASERPDDADDADGEDRQCEDADGLLDILTDGRDARIVPRRNAAALATAIVDLMDRPDERARLAAAARVTAGRYDIAAFVRKMEQLYVLLCDQNRAKGADLSFLADATGRGGREAPAAHQ